MATQQALQDFELPDAAVNAALEALPRSQSDGGALASFLGWFSLGLGTAEVAAPGFVARLIGVPDDENNCELVRAAGLRELASGLGILSRDRRAGWVWSRVGGDVMDLALLGSAFTSDRARRNRLIAATVAVAGVTALDVVAGSRSSRASRAAELFGVTSAITVNRSVSDVYAFWHDFTNLPRFMRHVEAVSQAGPRRWHWVVKGPAGSTLEWDAEVTDERQNELIAWRSLKGADVENNGSVRFRPAPAGRGTEVRVHLQYEPPGGTVGRGIAMLFGEEPAQQLHDDLRRFKQVLETGEIPRTAASESVLGMSRPGQPAPMPSYGEFSRGNE